MNIILEENIKRIINDWKLEKLPSLKTRKYKEFSLDNLNMVVAITGPRRAGKTFFMFQLIQELLSKNICKKEDILFINFEHPKLSNLKADDLLDIISIYENIYGTTPKYLFFDEIQKLKDRGKVIRYFHDQGFKIIISGSSSKFLLNEIGTELRGRYIHRLILPFSFKEFCLFNKLNYQDILGTSHEGLILNQFDKYLEYGGFPLVAKEENNYMKEEILKELYNTIYFRDLIERYKINEENSFKLLMSYTLDMFSSILVPKKFITYCSEIGLKVSKPTILKHMSYLEEAFFVFGCQKFGWTPKSHILNPKKVYLIDIGFSKLANNFSQNKGKILENIVAIHLFRNEKDIYYHEDKNECDFIIKDKIGLHIEQAIQVTQELNPHTEEREITGLLEAMKKYKLNEGTILTYNQTKEIEVEGKKIHILSTRQRLLKEE